MDSDGGVADQVHPNFGSNSTHFTKVIQDKCFKNVYMLPPLKRKSKNRYLSLNKLLDKRDDRILTDKIIFVVPAGYMDNAKTGQEKN